MPDRESCRTTAWRRGSTAGLLGSLIGGLGGHRIAPETRPKEAEMGEAREVMDRITEAAFSGDQEGLKTLYAPDAVAETPDQGTIRGQDGILAWFNQFDTALPDARFESAQKYEAEDTAIDEGWVVATNTGPLDLPDGTSIPPTGKSIRVRSCDIATVEGGRVKRHAFYYDQMEFLAQLGLAEGIEAGATRSG